MLAQIPVNVSAIYKGKTPDSTYLVPGDQIVVPGNKLKKIREILGFSQVLSFARVFGLPIGYLASFGRLCRGGPPWPPVV
jgi:hypothetical protein